MAISFINSYKKGLTVCQGSSDREACHAMMYGSLTMVIEKAGLQTNCTEYPIIEMSVNAFFNILYIAKFFDFPGTGHYRCNFQDRWKSRLNSVMQSIPRGYTNVHLEHFK